MSGGGGETGSHLLVASISVFDPYATWAQFIACSMFQRCSHPARVLVGFDPQWPDLNPEVARFGKRVLFYWVLMTLRSWSAPWATKSKSFALAARNRFA
jgi:hypothetical protein